jgi:transposase
MCLVTRARIVLLASEGWTNQEIAAELEVKEQTVGLWRKRFIERGLAGLEKDAPGRGRKPTVQHSAIEVEVLRKTTQEAPLNATHWSTRTMAAAMGISETSLRRIWHRNGLKPHLQRRFKVSNDPAFIEKLEDIVGLYMNPPESAIVFSLDEKSRSQAPDRAHPGLPLKKGRAGTMTHDQKRNGTASDSSGILRRSGSGGAPSTVSRTSFERSRTTFCSTTRTPSPSSG